MAAPGFRKIVLYHSLVASEVPDPASLEVGELAINIADRQIYTKGGGGEIVPMGGTPTIINLANQVFGILGTENGGTGITSFGTGVATALGQNVTGTGGIVLGTGPAVVDPILTLGGDQGAIGQVPTSQGPGLPPVWTDLPLSQSFLLMSQGVI